VVACFVVLEVRVSLGSIGAYRFGYRSVKNLTSLYETSNSPQNRRICPEARTCML
jgi:hypothetical protein